MQISLIAVSGSVHKDRLKQCHVKVIHVCALYMFSLENGRYLFLLFAIHMFVVYYSCMFQHHNYLCMFQHHDYVYVSAIVDY